MAMTSDATQVRDGSPRHVSQADELEVPPGYTRTEVGVIPEDWRIATLSELGHSLSGGTPSKSDPQLWGGDIPWVSSKDMKVARMRDSIDHVSPLALGNGTRLVQPGTILMVVRGMSLVHSFPVAIVEAPVAFNQDIKAFVPNREVSGEFVLRWLEASQAAILLLATEATHGTKRLPTGDLLGSMIPLPRPAEQRAIAEALSDVDGLLGALEALIVKKRAIKQATMQQLLTGKTRLPGFSGEWETKRLGDLAEMASGGTPKSTVDAYYGGNIPWVSIADMTQGGKLITHTERSLSKLGFSQSAARLYPVGTILYAMYASLGECSIAGVGLCSSQAILGISPGRDLDPEFLYYWLTAIKSTVKELGQQGTQANLNKGMVQDFQILLPSIEEQAAIATVLSDMDAEIAALEVRRDKTRAIKQGMMQQLLTGRVRLVKPEAAA